MQAGQFLDIEVLDYVILARQGFADLKEKSLGLRYSLCLLRHGAYSMAL